MGAPKMGGSVMPRLGAAVFIVAGEMSEVPTEEDEEAVKTISDHGKQKTVALKNKLRTRFILSSRSCRDKEQIRSAQVSRVSI